MTESGGLLTPLDGKSPVLFLLAGALLLVFVGVNVVQAFTDPAAYENLHATFGPAGLLFGFLGLLGLYPKLSDRTPRLARAGAAFVTIGAVGAAVTSVAYLGAAAGVFSGEPPAALAAFAIGILIGMIPGYLSFAVACLRTDVHSRTLGLLLLAPAIVFVTMLVSPLISTAALPIRAVVISSTQAVAHLAIGYVIWTGGIPTDRAEPVPDSTA